MGGVDLKPDYKCYYQTFMRVSFKTSREVEAKYFLDIIKKSKEDNEEFWIPAIYFEGHLYVSPEIKELSDGKRTMFVSREEVKSDKKRTTKNKRTHA